jgi:hypothetical protein
MCPADERPELSKGTYEIAATPEYAIRPPMAVTHVFLIDVSHTAVATGANKAACQCVEQALDSLQGACHRACAERRAGPLLPQPMLQGGEGGRLWASHGRPRHCALGGFMGREDSDVLAELAASLGVVRH